MIITAAIALALIKGLFPNKSPSIFTTTKETKLTTVNLADTVTAEKHLEPQQKQKPKCDEDDNIPFISTSDCHACPAPCADQDHLHYPSYLKMDYETPLLHSMKPYTRHVIISTGKDDWEHSIDDEKDSLAPYLQQAIDEGQERLRAANGGKDLPRIVLTNSSKFPEIWGGPGWQVTIFPDNIVVNNVTPEQCHDFFEAFLKPKVGATHLNSDISTTLTVEKDHGTVGIHYQQQNQNQNQNGKGDNTSSLFTKSTSSKSENGSTTHTITNSISTARNSTSSLSSSSSSSSLSTSASSISLSSHYHHNNNSEDTSREVTAGNTTFIAHKWQPKAVIMICSHRKRDKRCGVTAPILKKEFTRILRSKDIYGDCEGDVDIWLISHIGGHKFAGNVIVHKSEGMAVWYGHVEPCHTQAIVDVTIEDGKVIKELYRGCMIDSFDQSKKKMAW
ncbi:hypothetical protein BGZ76_002744 [Entomortierella beljakovae]|nr:hypothetical protein BGZ76_002744 [Entomortierella beljakovae]